MSMLHQVAANGVDCTCGWTASGCATIEVHLMQVMRSMPLGSVVDHPAHYGGDTVYEAIKVIEAWQLGFCLGNTVKYICRAGKKPQRFDATTQDSKTKQYVDGLPKDALVDLKKARWYLDREIEKMEKR